MLVGWLGKLLQRQLCANAAAAGGQAHLTVPGALPEEWLDAGQCRDCDQPAFNYRPRSSVQYLMALGRQTPEGDPLRFRFGFIASSDNHSARPGTGYKEVARTTFTETRFGNFLQTPLGRGADKEPRPRSKEVALGNISAPFLAFETERQALALRNPRGDRRLQQRLFSPRESGNRDVQIDRPRRTVTSRPRRKTTRMRITIVRRS